MTHCERVLQLLSDGKPHSHHELYGLHVIAHSRISDLRKQGYRIEQWRDGDLYLYRLLDETPLPDAGGVSSSGPGAQDGKAASTVQPVPPAALTSPGLLEPFQLSIGEAA